MTPIILADTVAQGHAYMIKRGIAAAYVRAAIEDLPDHTLRALHASRKVYVLGAFQHPVHLAGLRARGYRPVIAVPAW